ncbi:Phage holin [Paramixta manurensis]|uniref:Phage holin n=1 Tax=Paramixta manurensis TaxID=2740817 RepID=A0A6M8UEQ4_9GAMM|nr:Phage holin [Erwiniaceae bacterium PD-1]
MDQQPGSIVTHFFGWLAAIAAAMGVTTQDLVYIAFGGIGVVISACSFIMGRLDARAQRAEQRKRTSLIEDYLDDVSQRPTDKQPTAIEIVNEALHKAESADC